MRDVRSGWFRIGPSRYAVPTALLGVFVGWVDKGCERVAPLALLFGTSYPPVEAAVLRGFFPGPGDVRVIAAAAAPFLVLLLPPPVRA